MLEGAKWYGKSITAEHHSNSAVFIMDDPRKRSQYMIFAEDNPDIILNEKTRLIDKWQLAPMICDAVCYTVDHREGMGKFILTDSTKPAN